jgi:hypothetical protein
MRRRRNDPEGLRTCGRCDDTMPATPEYYHRNVRAKDGCTNLCKYCDNLVRKIRFQTKASHNLKMRCAHCESFFWKDLATRNKVIRKNKNARFYCSKSCASKENLNFAFGTKGASWNGARRGDKNPNAKMTNNQVLEIKASIKAGLRNCEIAKRFGMNPDTVSHIRHGKLWGDIE